MLKRKTQKIELNIGSMCQSSSSNSIPCMVICLSVSDNSIPYMVICSSVLDNSIPYMVICLSVSDNSIPYMVKLVFTEVTQQPEYWFGDESNYSPCLVRHGLPQQRAPVVVYYHVYHAVHVHHDYLTCLEARVSYLPEG